MRLIVAFLLLFPALAEAQVDQFASRIEVASGKLVVLSAAQADSVEWKLVNPPADDNHQVCDTRLMFSTGVPGEYWFVESGASIVDGKIKQKTLIHLVKVAGQAPPGTPPAQPPTEPGTPPTIPPQTPPTTPPAEALSDWVMKTAVATISGTRPWTGLQFATTYRRWSANGGKVANSVEEFARAQDAVNKAYIMTFDAGDKKEWDAFFKALAIKLSGMKLKTVAEAQAAWLEIADGLERASKVP